MPSAFLLRAHWAALHRSKAELLACEGWELAGVAQRETEALPRLPLLQPDLLLGDLRLLSPPLLNAARTTGLPVLAWSFGVDEPAQVEALAQGVTGFLLETQSPVRLCAQLNAALQGRHQVEPRLARELLRRMGAARLSPEKAAQPAMAADTGTAGLLRLLSVGQQALLSLLAHGYLPREIANAWALEVEEVERRVGHLLRLLPRLWSPAVANPAAALFA